MLAVDEENSRSRRTVCTFAESAYSEMTHNGMCQAAPVEEDSRKRSAGRLAYNGGGPDIFALMAGGVFRDRRKHRASVVGFFGELSAVKIAFCGADECRAQLLPLRVTPV